MSSFDIKPGYICDNNSKKWGRTYHEIPMISPQQLAEINEKNSNVLIQLTTNASFEEEILVQLNHLNITQIISSSEALNRLGYYQICDYLQENPLSVIYYCLISKSVTTIIIHLISL